ncbi:hydroxymethylglutaryl-coA synthase [Vairimorpha necatrix]|uniref:Hydroxymethylglutaryl-coA synthase n=1 Tax=Vairimorpha necatrix TaxID=6039 RepID=A0AAX4JDS6_9MICR
MTEQISVGIVGIEYQLPCYKIDEAEIAPKIGWELNKIKIGLGMHEFGVVGHKEDVVSLALSAVDNLLVKYNVDPKDVGKIEVGTESHFDSAKSIKTYLLQLFNDNVSIAGCDTTNACYGGTNALLNCLAWMESSFCKHKYAIVVCTDISMYDSKPAVPTSGAGAVAMLIGRDPVYKVLPKTLFTYSTNEKDFLKHKSRYFPYIEGKESVEVYKKAFSNVYNEFISEFSPDYFNYMAFHSPFPKMVVKVCNEFNIPLEKVEDSLLASRHNGNTYTASLYFSLISLIASNKVKMNDVVCLFSFGSGCVGSIYCIQKVKEGCEIEDLRERLDSRKLINYEKYEEILENMQNYAIKDEEEDIKGYSIVKEENYFRTYIKK